MVVDLQSAGRWCTPSTGDELYACDVLRVLASWGRMGCTMWWTIAIGAYLAKWASGGLDDSTKYGKLRPDSRLSTGIAPRGFSFLVFYTWALFWAQAALILRLIAGTEGEFGCSFGDVALPLTSVLFILHLCRRWVETLLVHKFSPKERMEPLNFISALGYYFFVNVTVADAELGPMHLTDAEKERLPQWTEWLSGSGPIGQAGGAVRDGGNEQWLLIGIVLFVLGNFLQYYHHQVLASLRPSRKNLFQAMIGGWEEDGGKRTYDAPTGGLFRWFSCPHYISEIVLYIGLLLVSVRGDITRATTAMWLLQIFVLLNLGHSAYRQKHFYWEKCKAQRWVLVPYVF